ncbi:hypothetical protein C8R44DRAFT_741661 [Mycena epipterygia]|nr:hypothetical protein C8R44DRAFT_741661 [Mycena epipterygia]
MQLQLTLGDVAWAWAWRGYAVGDNTYDAGLKFLVFLGLGSMRGDYSGYMLEQVPSDAPIMSSTAAAAINHGGEDSGNDPNIIGKERNDVGSPIPRTSQAISQATPSTPAPPNSNSAKGRKPFGQAIP